MIQAGICNLPGKVSRPLPKRMQRFVAHKALSTFPPNFTGWFYNHKIFPFFRKNDCIKNVSANSMPKADQLNIIV